MPGWSTKIVQGLCAFVHHSEMAKSDGYPPSLLRWPWTFTRTRMMRKHDDDWGVVEVREASDCTPEGVD